jgi:putative transposase
MPRRARLAVPGIPWHIIQRGNNRSTCFITDVDCENYLSILNEQAMQYGCAVHAYVLMSNHIHLLLTPAEVDSAAQLMKQLGQRYAQYINRTYKRTGTLWDGRFRSCLTQNEEYVLSCYRYVELNPVRVNLVKHPREYRWSSFQANANGKTNDYLRLTPHAEYLRLGTSITSCQHAYRSLFHSRLDPKRVTEIRNATNGNFVLGDIKFQQHMARKLNRRVTPGKSGRPVRIFR